MPRASTTERGVTRSTTERGARPMFEKSSDTELDDNNATLIQPTPTHFVGGRWRQPRAAVSADDTVRMDGDATNDVREARDRLPVHSVEALLRRAAGSSLQRSAVPNRKSTSLLRLTMRAPENCV